MGNIYVDLYKNDDLKLEEKAVFYVGGIVGYFWGDLTSCYNIANLRVKNKDWYISGVGGLVGFASAGNLILNSYSVVDSLSGHYFGCLVGISSSCRFKTTYYNNLFDPVGDGVIATDQVPKSKQEKEMKSLEFAQKMGEKWDCKSYINFGYPYLKDFFWI